MTKRSIYLDYAATTPVDPVVAAAMRECLELDGTFANPSSSHSVGQRARRRVEEARAQIAARVGAPAETISFTSGATESDNLAIQGAMLAHRDRGRHLITSRTEHKAVLDTAAAMEKQGFDVTYLSNDSEGVIAPDQVADAIRADTTLVAIMHVNNETGVVQDIAAIGECCRSRGVLLHVDAAQSIGKVPVQLDQWAVDLVALTAHKAYGPKGIGALYVRPGTKLAPLLHGGEQEGGVRPGTLATHQIVGMGQAYELADTEREAPALAEVRDRLWAGLSAIEGVRLNGHPTQRSPHVLNVAFPGVDGESLRLGIADIAVSAGAACNSSAAEASHVLSALGLSDALAASSQRFSVGRFTAADEIDYVIERVTAEVGRLRELAGGAPAWCAK
ncbi:MAG: aminotransferase class V-fold PLP-dependent enzyme [Gammaproteobacteria bacterium]